MVFKSTRGGGGGGGVVKTWIFVVNSQTFGQGVREDNSVEESVQYTRVTFEYLKGALSAKS